MTVTKLVDIKREAQKDLQHRGQPLEVRDTLEQLVTVADKLLAFNARGELNTAPVGKVNGKASTSS